MSVAVEKERKQVDEEGGAARIDDDGVSVPALALSQLGELHRMVPLRDVATMLDGFDATFGIVNPLETDDVMSRFSTKESRLQINAVARLPVLRKIASGAIGNHAMGDEHEGVAAPKESPGALCRGGKDG